MIEQAWLALVLAISIALIVASTNAIIAYLKSPSPLLPQRQHHNASKQAYKEAEKLSLQKKLYQKKLQRQERQRSEQLQARPQVVQTLPRDNTCSTTICPTNSQMPWLSDAVIQRILNGARYSTHTCEYRKQVGDQVHYAKTTTTVLDGYQPNNMYTATT